MFIPELGDIISKFVKIYTEFISVMQSDALRSFSDLASQLQSYTFDISKISFPNIPLPKIQIPKNLNAFAREYTYLKNLETIEWPLFIYDNDNLKNRLTAYFNNCEDTVICNTEIVNSIIFEEITDEDVIRLADEWEASSVISTNRIPILYEGIELYKQGYYYGCVSLMMCQLNGIITDIYKMHSDFGIKYTAEDFQMAHEEYMHKVYEGKIKIKKARNSNCYV